MSTIKFGPAGLGSVKDAINNLEMFHKLGFKACEIAFTYGPYIKEKEDAVAIGKAAKRLGIFLSIHAPYYVNLNSKESEKIEASKKRILKCCEVGSWLGVERVVFHPGFYSGMSSVEASVKIKEGILEMQEVIKKNKWNVELCPEVMGKKNVFGSIDEIGDLVGSTGCGFCIDFAHVLARYGRYEFDKIVEMFKEKRWHVHFSGIEFGEKGEKKHLITPTKDWNKVLKFLKGLNKDVVLICESPDPVGDSIVGISLCDELK
ncbi:MAG: TIM barrel protein [archaeon]